jgi:two-component system KDP operon response regulator KdpE
MSIISAARLTFAEKTPPRCGPMTMRRRILVVDHDPQLRKLLCVSLGTNGYDVIAVNTASEGIATMLDHAADLIVLELALPDMNGQDVITVVRETSDIPIIVLSMKAEGIDKVEALDRGADDFVTKPFNVAELIARIGAVLRPRSAVAVRQVLRLGPVEIDMTRQIVSRGGCEVRLSKKEWELLSMLARHPNQVLTHGHILAEVWGRHNADNTAYLRVYVNQLRQKLEPDPARPTLILTEPTLGYRLRWQN